MIARTQALTGLEFNASAIRSATRANVGGTVVDSTVGWPLDHLAPHYRKVLSPVAVRHGYFENSEDPTEEHINERVHWSVLAKRQDRTTRPYSPQNLPADIPNEKIAAIPMKSGNSFSGPNRHHAPFGASRYGTCGGRRAERAIANRDPFADLFDDDHMCLFRAHWDWLGRQRRPNRRYAGAGKISDKDDYGHSDYLPPTAPNKWPRAADFMRERFLVSHT
jgi:hypothetical protein